MRPKRHKPGEEMEPVEVYARVKAIPEYDDRKRVFSLTFNFSAFKKIYIQKRESLKTKRVSDK